MMLLREVRRVATRREAAGAGGSADMPRLPHLRHSGDQGFLLYSYQPFQAKRLCRHALEY